MSSLTTIPLIKCERWVLPSILCRHAHALWNAVIFIESFNFSILAITFRNVSCHGSFLIIFTFAEVFYEGLQPIDNQVLPGDWSRREVEVLYGRTPANSIRTNFNRRSAETLISFRIFFPIAFRLFVALSLRTIPCNMYFTFLLHLVVVVFCYASMYSSKEGERARHVREPEFLSALDNKLPPPPNWDEQRIPTAIRISKA